MHIYYYTISCPELQLFLNFDKKKNNFSLPPTVFPITILLLYFLYTIFVDYDYDFYGYSDYRGGYNDSYYDDYFRSYDGEQFFDYTSNSGAGPQTNQRNNRNISVGLKN